MNRSFWKSSIFVSLLILSIGLVPVSCKKGDNKTAQAGADSMTVTAIPVIVEQVEKRDLNEYLTITGTLEGIVDITMSSETSGRVVEVFRKLGDPVKKGEAIGQIDNTDQQIQLEQAQAGLLSAEAGLEAARLAMDSAETLFRNAQISQAEYARTKSNLKQAQAGYDGARAGHEKARKALEYSRFVAPVSGVVTEMNIEVGEMVNMGTPVCRIVDTGRLLVKTGVGETGVAGLKRGQQVMVTRENDEATYQGVIRGIGVKPLQGTANYPVEIEIPNRGNTLLPGMVVRGSVHITTYKDVVYTTPNNLIREYDDTFVFIVSASKAEKRKVTLGRKSGDNVVINAGLNPGDQLVVEGASSLENGSLVDIRKIAADGSQQTISE